MKLQAPREIMTTYLWIFLGLFIVVLLGVVMVLFWPQPPTVQHLCLIASGFTCDAAALGSYSGGSVLFLRITNNIGAGLTFASNSIAVQTSLSNSTYNGACWPSYVDAGGNLFCTVYITGYAPQYGAIVDPKFEIQYGSCGGVCSGKSGGYVVSGTTYVTSGLSLQQAENITSKG